MNNYRATTITLLLAANNSEQSLSEFIGKAKSRINENNFKKSSNFELKGHRTLLNAAYMTHAGATCTNPVGKQNNKIINQGSVAETVQKTQSPAIKSPAFSRSSNCVTLRFILWPSLRKKLHCGTAHPQWPRFYVVVLRSFSLEKSTCRYMDSSDLIFASIHNSLICPMGNMSNEFFRI